MSVFIMLLLFLVPSITQLASDPAPGLLRSKESSRNLDCERTTTDEAKKRFPGEIKTSSPRGDFIDRSAVLCTQRIMKKNERDSSHEAILMNLEKTASGFATTIETLNDSAASQIWHVESFFPHASVSAKISFATKNALVNRGLRVSDRVPMLAAGDIEVLAQMPPDQAYPLACRRYFEQSELRENHALIGVVLRDPRETILHAGVCTEGKWTWIQ